MFGGEDAVSTASGFEPQNILNGAYRGDTTGDNGQPVFGHLGSRAMHLRSASIRQQLVLGQVD